MYTSYVLCCVHSTQLICWLNWECSVSMIKNICEKGRSFWSRNIRWMNFKWYYFIWKCIIWIERRKINVQGNNRHCFLNICACMHCDIKCMHSYCIYEEEKSVKQSFFFYSITMFFYLYCIGQIKKCTFLNIFQKLYITGKFNRK